MMFKKATIGAVLISISAPAVAEEDKEVSILAALGLTAASGKTTLAEGAGEMEGVILASAMFPAAVQELKAAIHGSDGKLRGVDGKALSAAFADRTVAILDHDDPFDLSLSGLVTNQIKKAIPKPLSCSKFVKPFDPNKGGWFGLTEMDVDTSGAGLAATAIGVAKVDTEISSYSVTIPEHHLIASLAASFADKAILPSEISVAPTVENSEVLAAHASLLAAKSVLTPCAKDAGVAKQLEKIKAVDAAVIAPGKDDGPSLLERAAKQGIIAQQKPLLLRLNMEKAGGTVINRSNIFLQFGLPGALVIHNGMKLNYRLVDPGTGQVLNAGTVLCRQPTPKKFETVYRTSIENLRKTKNGNKICERVVVTTGG